MAAILFAISALLLTWTTWLLVRWFPREQGVRFWATLAAVNLQLTFAHLLTSVFHAFTPLGFLGAQIAFAIVAKWLVPRLAPKLGAQLHAVGRPEVITERWYSGPIVAVLLAVILAVCGLSLAEQMLRPITGFDERMYNCSRVLYWMDHRHIWPWVTHNDAQADFPIGSEVFFSWPILFTRTEWIGRLVYWLGFPAAVAGIYVLARQLAASRSWAMAAALLFAAAPAILYASGVNQKQDIWTAAMLCGASYWLVRCWHDGKPLDSVMTGLFIVLAINVKITCIAIAPLVIIAAIAPWLTGKDGAITRLKFQASGVVLGLVLSGLGVTLVLNFRSYGNPMGPPAAARALSPDWTDRQVYTHAVRIPFFLLDLPALPAGDFRNAWVEGLKEELFRLDAHRALPGERRGTWPGAFKTSDVGNRFSLGGIAWLSAMPWVALSLVRVFARSRRRPLMSGPAIVLIASAVQLAALVFLLRWSEGAPDRYWVGPYAIGLAAACAGAHRILARRPVITGLCLMLAAWSAYPPAIGVKRQVLVLRSAPVDVRAADEPYAEIVSKLPSNASILLFANRNTRDYPLFLPRRGYTGRITPWGRAKFDTDRLSRLVNNDRITHAVFESDERLGFHWYTGIKVFQMVDWFLARPDFREVPLTPRPGQPRQRLFERIAAPATAPSS